MSKGRLYDNFSLQRISDERMSDVSWRKTKKPPKTKEEVNGNKDFPYVKWGKKHFPLFLNELYEKSPSQRGIINGKVYYMTAGGFTIEGADQALFEKKWSNGHSLLSVVKASAKDYEIYNGFCYTGRWIMGKVHNLAPMDFSKILTTKNKDRFFYSDDWTAERQSFQDTGFREIKKFDPENPLGEFIVYYSEKGKQVEKGCLNVYPTAPYAGCIESLMTEIEFQSFHFFETQNGFKSGTIIFLPSAKVKSETDRKILSDQVKIGATDRETSGGVMVLIGEGGTDAPTVLQLNGNDLDKRYLQTDTSVKETIMIGHSVGTPGLFGIRTAGKLGDVQELETGFKIFKETYVQSRQEPLNESFADTLQRGFKVDGIFKLNAPAPIVGAVESTEDTSAEVANAINSLSPLVATKLLDNMTPNEIRGLGKLPPVEGGDELPTSNVDQTTPSEFAAKDPVLKAFHKCGLKKSRFIVKESKAVPHDVTSDWFDQTENELFEGLKNEKIYFATLLNELQKNVLALINDGQDAKAISTALNKSIGDVMNTYGQLVSKGLIKKNNELSETGKRYLDSNEVPADKFEIRYSYEKRPEAPKLIGDSRPFCKELMELNKLYTRAEIDMISSALGNETNQFDVWNYRGGWYHNPDTQRNTPYCRHYWQQNVVLKK